MKTSASRINQKYRPHLSAIAKLFVQCGGNGSATERAVRQIAGCESFKAEFLKRWITKAEFAAEVRAAEEGAEALLQLRPDVRGPRRILWLKGIEDQLRQRYESGESQAEKDDTLKVLLKVGEDLRAEEKHVEELSQKAARRQFAGFVKNMVAFVKLKHPNSHATLFPVFRDILVNLEGIQAGRFEN